MIFILNSCDVPTKGKLDHFSSSPCHFLASSLTMTEFRNVSTIFFFYTCLFLCFQLISTVRFDDIANQHHRSRTMWTKPGAPFKIALFADLHFGESAWSNWGPRQDVNSTRVMSSVLGYEIPREIINLKFVFFHSFLFFMLWENYVLFFFFF